MEMIFKHKKGLIAPLMLVLLQTLAQDSLQNTAQTFTLKTEFFQIKDAFNYGLVFNGLNLGFRYTLERTTNNRTIIYAPEFTFGANYNKGVGLAWGLVPIDIFYGTNFKKRNSNPFAVGGYFAADYNWQLYPELQSGHMFWFTSLEFGPQITTTLPVKSSKLKIILSNSLFGFVSRPETGAESYHYSLAFSDFVKNAHSDLQFGSYNVFNHTNLEVQLINRKTKRLSLAYQFEYFGYYQDPVLNYISHGLNLNWKLGKL